MLVRWAGRSTPPGSTSIRRTTPGGLVLGFDFVWSDLTDYAVGVGLGILIEPASPHDRSVPGR